MRRHPRRLKLLVFLVAVIGVLAVLTLQGSLEIADPHGARAAWTAPCLAGPPRTDRELLARCARVKGRVLWVTRKGGLPNLEVHILLTVDFGLVIVKLTNPEPAAVPGVASRLTAVGPMVRSRNGLREVQGFALR